MPISLPEQSTSLNECLFDSLEQAFDSLERFID